MPKKIDLNPAYRANLPRTGHNLSHDYGFTATTGHLLPVFHDFLNPGETVTLGFDFNLRTQPLDAAAMSKLITHTEYFFVPMQLLYQGFSDWYYGIREEWSSKFLVSDVIPQFNLPKVDLRQLYDQLYANRTAKGFTDAGSRTFASWESDANSAYRLFDHFGFRPDRIMDGTTTTTSDGAVFPYQILAYNCIYQYYYRLDTRELFRPQSFNVDQYGMTGVITPSSFVKYCTLQYRPFDSDYFTDIKVSPIVDVLNLNNRTDLAAATDFLTDPGKVHSGFNGQNPFNPASFGGGDPTKFIQTQFGMKYLDTGADSNDDYAVTSVDFNDESVSDSLFIDNVNFGIEAQNGIDIGTANIRAMFASEKLWSVTGRAKKQYDDQTLAHFGFKVPHDPKHKISQFGHDTTEIHIGEVISTSNTYDGTAGSALGEIAGKGYAAQGGKRHKFTAPCHGVVMVIFSVVPQEFYEDAFLKANKVSDRSDFYTPEYDHLGMQPLYRYEVYRNGAGQDILGWQYRYEQWKRRFNRVSSVFAHGVTYGVSKGSLSSWIHSMSPLYAYVSGDMPNQNDYYKFLHAPDELNDIMLVNYNLDYSTAFATKPYLVYETDPFVVCSHIDCVKVSTMSDYSLPRLDA